MKITILVAFMLPAVFLLRLHELISYTTTMVALSVLMLLTTYMLFVKSKQKVYCVDCVGFSDSASLCHPVCTLRPVIDANFVTRKETHTYTRCLKLNVFGYCRKYQLKYKAGGKNES